MRVLTLDDVEKMAEAVVAEHLGGAPLLDSLSKKASGEGLNPDQVTNLVQLANVLTHLKLFDQKNDGDKVINFEPISPDSVLKQIYSNTDPASGASEKAIVMEGNSPSSDPVSKAMDFFGDLPCCHGGSDGGNSEVSQLGSGVEDLGSRGPREQSISIIRIRKVAEDLRDRREAVAIDYRGELDKLAADFAQLYGPDLEEFEKHAVQIYGFSAVDPLSNIRKTLRVPSVRYSLSKTAGVIDTDTPQFKSLQKLMKLSAEFDELSAAGNYVQEKFGGVL